MGLLVLSPCCLLTCYLCAEEKGPGELGSGVERECSKLAEMKIFFLNIEDRRRDVRPWSGRVEEAGHVLKCRSHQEPAIAPHCSQGSTTPLAWRSRPPHERQRNPVAQSTGLGL